jgi:hypothetical protein
MKGKSKPTAGDRTQEMIRQNKALKDERRLQVKQKTFRRRR